MPLLTRSAPYADDDLPAPIAPPEHLERTLAALRRKRGFVTIGDAMAETGLAREEAEAALKSLLADYSGHLEVTDAGDLLYRFDPRLLRRDHRSFGQRLWAGVKAVLTVGFKVGIMVTLVGYSIFFAIAALALLIGLLTRNSDNDVDSDTILAVLYLPMRAFMELLFWFPDWFYWGTMRHRSLSRGQKDDKPHLHERVFSFAFGPRRPESLPAERDRARAEMIRELQGVVTPVDVMRAQGSSKGSADEELGRLLGRFGGDVKVTDDGQLLYLFPELARSTAAAPSWRPAGAPRWAALERRLSLTGNDTKSNLLIGALSTVTLVGAIGFGVALLPKLGIVAGIAYVGLVYLPLVVGAGMLLLPALRSVRLQRENRQLDERNLRRVLLAGLARDGADGAFSAAGLRGAAGAALGDARVDDAAVLRITREMAAELEAEVEGERTDGSPRYRTAAIRQALEAARVARGSLRLDRPVDAPIVFSTDDDEATADHRDAEAFQRELERGAGKSLPDPD